MHLELPYTYERRADTGVTNPTLGVWLFLASEVMLFGSLFSSYALLRSGASSWPDQSSIVSIPLGAVNTMLLIASSVLIGRAYAALRADATARFRLLALATLACGVLFVGIKAYEWIEKLQHGLVPATNNFVALYFAMTGLHAVHLLGGIAVIGYLAGPGLAMVRDERPRFVERIKVSRLYWNFVDGVWIALFVVFYLL